MGCYKSNSKSEIYSAKFTYLKIEISQINNFISQATRKELSSSYRVKKDQSRNKEKETILKNQIRPFIF